MAHWLIALALALAVLAIAGPSVKKVEVPVFQRADCISDRAGLECLNDRC